MNPERLFSPEDLKILQKARDTYGPHKQVGVAAEECTELAKELIKAFRYDDFDTAVSKTKKNVVDETADLIIVLDHIIKLYNITERDLDPHIRKKIDRLQYWLDSSDSIEFTTENRNLPSRGNVYVVDGVRLVDYNDQKYREDNE